MLLYLRLKQALCIHNSQKVEITHVSNPRSPVDEEPRDVKLIETEGRAVLLGSGRRAESGASIQGYRVSALQDERCSQ